MNRVKQTVSYHLNQLSFSAWVIPGFLVAYLFFFVGPVFLNSLHTMQFFRYIPTIDPIGIDLEQTLGFSQSWFIANKTPYIGDNSYPPFCSVVFSALLFVDFSTAYTIITVVNIVCYLFITLVIPLITVADKRLSPLLMLFVVTGLFSYGFQFELERGQFNVIAFTLCLLAIWIYHYQHKSRHWAYVLFSISIQLKVFPAIFVIMFINDWPDWKNNIKRFLGLGAVNFALFFILGPRIFIDFVNATVFKTMNPYVWVGNHSIRAFVTLISTTIHKYQIHNLFWLDKYLGLMQDVMLIFVIGCILLMMFWAYQQTQTGLNPYLLLACTLGALLIPSVSHDYTLALLAAPVAMCFCTDRVIKHSDHRLRWLTSFLVFVFFLAYPATLFSNTNRPIFLANSLPVLMVMLLVTTVLFFIVNPAPLNVNKAFEPDV